MIITALVAAAVAGIAQLAQAAGQGIQQWLNSPQGQQQIQNLIQQFGPDVIREALKKLGIHL